MKTLIERWKAETPAFFKKVIKLAVGIVAGAGAVIALKEAGNIPIPEKIVTICYYILIAGTFTGLTSKLTKR